MKITGQVFRDMVISAANALDNNKEEINNLNVFPVPDGDTGINMSLTMGGCRTELSSFDGTLSDCADKIGNLMLRCARGNSGVILSVFFRGMAKSLAGKDEADVSDMADAMRRGADDAYKAVMKPTEGTILTVMRVCAEQAQLTAGEQYKDDIEGFFRYMLSVASDTLEKTPDMLPALKEAQVVDSGGRGFVCVLEGMLASLEGAPIQQNEPANTQTKAAADFASFDTENIQYPYCTECIVSKDDKHFGEDKSEKLHKYAMSMGDSVVFIESTDMIKLHVHTENPGKILTEALKFGSLYTVKIENMRNQHTTLANGAANSAPPPRKPYAFVAVAMGDGIRDSFIDLGADKVVYGGQTMNPSTDDIISAVNEVNAKVVYVLPNNKNIYMVAKQAQEMIDDCKVVVIPTRSVPQGIAAMMVFDESADVKANENAMNDATFAVTTLSVTYAVRDSVVGDKTIKEGSVLGMLDGKIACVADDDEECLEALTARVSDASIVTAFYGEDVSEEQAEKAEQIIRSKLNPLCEVIMVNGGQPLYHYVISAEY